MKYVTKSPLRPIGHLPYISSPEMQLYYKFDFCGDEMLIAEKLKEHFGVKE